MFPLGLPEVRLVPEWEEYPHTPGVFARVANKGVAGYGTWKSVRKMGDAEEEKGIGGVPPPTFFGTAHSKGLKMAGFWNCAF